MMQAPSTFASVWSALGATVVHFLWQGALIGLCAMVLLWCLRHKSAAARYAVACATMLMCLLAFVATLFTALAGPGSEGSLQAALAGSASEMKLAAGIGVTEIAAWCWAAGALLMAVRFTHQCCQVRRLKTTDVSAPDARWQSAFQTLKQQLGVARGVRLMRSGLAEVPMVVGWLSPIVLVPVSAFTALSPDQLRSLLAHELAHIRRYDHLLNAAQAAIEIVLFFHPAVWWISKQVRLEREYCCDDSSVRLMGDPRVIAEALAAVEALRITQPRTDAVLASNGGPLMQRISRILGMGHESPKLASSWQLPAGLLLAGVVAVAGNAYASPLPQDKNQAQVDKAAQQKARNDR